MRATINYLVLLFVLSAVFAERPQPKRIEDTPAAVSPARRHPPAPDAIPAAAGVPAKPVAPVETAAAPLAPCKVVYFTATWCGPCRAGKLMAKEACVATDSEFVEVDVDQFAAYSKRWGVDKCPTVIVTIDGKERWRWEGVLESPQLAEAIGAARRQRGWNVPELCEEIESASRRINPRERWDIAGMTAFEHLTRDHDWPAETVRQLTEEQQLWLHDATHRGWILP